MNKDIWIYDTSKENLLPIIYLGKPEPDEDICWIEMDVSEGFEALIESCLQLLDAGYPGCNGCVDTVQEGRWNEREFRFHEKKIFNYLHAEFSLDTIVSSNIFVHRREFKYRRRWEVKHGNCRHR